MPFEAWVALGAKIGTLANATPWWLGDWLAFGQMKYGRRYKDAIAATGLEYKTLRNYAVVARRFEVSRRRDNLTFQHHAEVCALSDEAQQFWLDLAAQHGWSTSELRRRVRASGVARERDSSTRVLRLVLTSQEEELWRRAARRSDCRFETWVRTALDEAATRALAPGHVRPAIAGRNGQPDADASKGTTT